jgi:hypothetical protein
VPSKEPVVRFVLPSAEPHPAGCLCCTPRGPVADALGRLFLARARGETLFFRLVVAITEDARGRAAICSALKQDAFVSARYRLEPP